MPAADPFERNIPMGTSTLKDIYGNPVKNLETAIIVSREEAERRLKRARDITRRFPYLSYGPLTEDPDGNPHLHQV